jgi:hypothetical protein
MPTNIVEDLITDKEIEFAHGIMSGTMTDRQAAEAAGLNPDTASYTKTKPRVRAYMQEHRAAVAAKLVDLEVEALRQRNRSRDQTLARLWELANLTPEATRGSIAGQVKAMAMIVAIEGLIPDRRNAQTQPAPPPARLSTARQPEAEGTDPAEVVAASAQAAKPEPQGNASSPSHNHSGPGFPTPPPAASSNLNGTQPAPAGNRYG